MLKNIPSILSPQLIETLSEMRHGDTIVLGDANFPSCSIAKRGNTKFLRADGLKIPDLLDAILSVIPLDDYSQNPILLMEKIDRDKDIPTPIWNKYENIITSKYNYDKSVIGFLDRESFYKFSQFAYCNVQTGEMATYANIMIKKGIVVNK